MFLEKQRDQDKYQMWTEYFIAIHFQSSYFVKLCKKCENTYEICFSNTKEVQFNPKMPFPPQKYETNNTICMYPLLDMLVEKMSVF